MTNRFVGDRGRTSSLDISTRSGERFPRRIPRANLSETSPRDPKERDIYRADLKYKVAARDGGWSRKDRGLVPIFWKIAATTRYSNRARGSCLETQRPRGRNVACTRNRRTVMRAEGSQQLSPFLLARRHLSRRPSIGMDFFPRRTRRRRAFVFIASYREFL